MEKTVSVVMCTYNGAKYLREQLDSIISQTYPIYELIIQDDCSTDDTVAIVKEYMEKYSFIKLYINEHNLGFNQNFKSAAMKATGDYVALSDQDDVWFPNKLEKQVATIGNYDICCSPCLRGKELSTSHIHKWKYKFEYQLFNATYGHTMLCRRDFLERDESWMPTLWFDWGLSVQACLHRGIISVGAPLNWHRQHDGEVTTGESCEKSSIFAPYIKGYAKYRKLQQNENWQYLYSYIYQHTDNRFPLIHKMCGLLLKKDILSLLYLCLICMKHRDDIYPSNNTNGIMGPIRGFFFPLINAYFNHDQYRVFPTATPSV